MLDFMFHPRLYLGASARRRLVFSKDFMFNNEFGWMDYPRVLLSILVDRYSLRVSLRVPSLGNPLRTTFGLISISC